MTYFYAVLMQEQPHSVIPCFKPSKNVEYTTKANAQFGRLCIPQNINPNYVCNSCEAKNKLLWQFRNIYAVHFILITSDSYRALVSTFEPINNFAYFLKQSNLLSICRNFILADKRTASYQITCNLENLSVCLVFILGNCKCTRQAYLCQVPNAPLSVGQTETTKAQWLQRKHNCQLQV